MSIRIQSASSGFPKVTFFALSANYVTASLTDLSVGSGITIIAPSTGNLLILGVARVSNSIATDGAAATLYRSTVGIPAQGVAPAGGDVSLRASSVTEPIAGA